jgi:hypothetical protein
MTTLFLVENVDGHTMKIAASVLTVDTDNQLYEFSNVDRTAVMKLPMREVKAITTAPQVGAAPLRGGGLMRSG